MIALLLQRYGLYVALVLALLLLGAALYFGGRSAGRAAAVVDALKRSIRNTEEAARARAAVKANDKEAMDNDTFNRERSQ